MSRRTLGLAGLLSGVIVVLLSTALPATASTAPTAPVSAVVSGSAIEVPAPQGQAGLLWHELKVFTVNESGSS
jgi:hypothetical protein